MRVKTRAFSELQSYYLFAEKYGRPARATIRARPGTWQAMRGATSKLTHGLSRRFAHAFDSHWTTLARNTKLPAALAIAIAEGHPNVAAQRLDAWIDALEAFTRGTLDRP